MTPTESLSQTLPAALHRRAYLAALALLHQALDDKSGNLFGAAREDLSLNFPEEAVRKNRIDSLATQLAAFYLDDEALPADISSANPLLLAAALARQIAAGPVGQVAHRSVTIGNAEYHVFPQKKSYLSKDWASLRCWFFPVWLVSSPTRQKRLNIAMLDWPKAEPTCCALIEFDDRVALEKHHAGDTFIVTALKDEERRRTSLMQALDAARQADAQILVLPELSIAPALLDTLCDWLLGQADHPFRLIVAGSYHHRNEGDPLAWNRMPVLDHCGEVLLHHDKWFEFDRDENRHERIHPGNTLHLLGTPVGWLSFAICKDFCHADGFDWKTLALDGVCVASMGTEKTLSAHDAMARNEKLVATRVLLANNTPASCGSQRGFYSLPGEAPQPNQNTVTVWEWDKPDPAPRGKPQLKIIK